MLVPSEVRLCGGPDTGPLKAPRQPQQAATVPTALSGWSAVLSPGPPCPRNPHPLSASGVAFSQAGCPLTGLGGRGVCSNPTSSKAHGFCPGCSGLSRVVVSHWCVSMEMEPRGSRGRLSQGLEAELKATCRAFWGKEAAPPCSGLWGARLNLPNSGCFPSNADRKGSTQNWTHFSGCPVSLTPFHVASSSEFSVCPLSFVRKLT